MPYLLTVLCLSSQLHSLQNGGVLFRDPSSTFSLREGKYENFPSLERYTSELLMSSVPPQAPGSNNERGHWRYCKNLGVHKFRVILATDQEFVCMIWLVWSTVDTGTYLYLLTSRRISQGLRRYWRRSTSTTCEVTVRGQHMYPYEHGRLD